MNEVEKFRTSTIRDITKYSWNNQFHITLWEHLKESDPGLPKWTFRQLVENGWNIELPSTSSSANSGFIYLNHKASNISKPYRVVVNETTMPIPTSLIFGILLTPDRPDAIYLNKWQYYDVFDSIMRRLPENHKSIMTLYPPNGGFYYRTHPNAPLFMFAGLENIPYTPKYKGEIPCSAKTFCERIIGTGSRGFYFREAELKNRGIPTEQPPEWERWGS